MNAKGITITVLLVGGLAFWFLGEDERPAPPADSSTPPKARQAYREPPRQTQAPEPRFDYPFSRPPQPYAGGPQSAPFAPPPTAPYGSNAWTSRDAEAYRFRPLNDADRRRQRIPEEPAFRSTAPRAATRNFPAGPWPQGDYRFRPFSPGDGDNSRYRPNDPDYPWATEPDYAESWQQPTEDAPPPPRQPAWQPPSRLMLPSLDWHSDRTLTAR
jgi:hypothetical protein